MARQQIAASIFDSNLRARPVVVFLAVLATLTVCAPAQAQTFTILHTFTGAADGGNPWAGLTIGGSGTLYGTTSAGGTTGNGVVFRLSEKNGSWILSPLYEFTGQDDGSGPVAGVTVGPDGSLYGTTPNGGSAGGGTVFRLRPPLTVCKAALCYWNETTIHTFTGSPDGAQPELGNLIFDPAGNMYNTTFNGGIVTEGCEFGCGVVYEISPSGSGWAANVLYNFPGSHGGSNPASGLIFDSAGNLYGTTTAGGTGQPAAGGIVYELMPANGTWTEGILANLDPSTGLQPWGTLLMDQSGNLFDTTFLGWPSGNAASVFEVTPSNGGWTLSSLLNPCCGAFSSFAGLTMDTAGNLWGVSGGIDGASMVFELTYANGQWNFHDIYNFTFGSDGGDPRGPIVIDSSGNLYGTTYAGGVSGPGCAGSQGCGVVWEITP